MVWPFNRKERQIAAFTRDMDAAITLCAEKWRFFSDTLKFKDSVSLKDQISMFYVPMSEGLANSFKSMANAPEPALLMVVVMGVHRSGTHSKAQIEDAMGVPLVGVE